MDLGEIVTDQHYQGSHWIVWRDGTFQVESGKPENIENNRETLARAYAAYVRLCGGEFAFSSRFVRGAWTKEDHVQGPKTLPGIVREDGFLCRYAMGWPLPVYLARSIWALVTGPKAGLISRHNPIYIEWNPDADLYYDVDATPPGFLPKILRRCRLRKDEILFKETQSDLVRLSALDDLDKKRWLTLGVLSHSVAYREINNRVVRVPHLHKPEGLVTYTCEQHLISEGVKTYSLTPADSTAPGIYLCQGTELWPSQSSMMGSIIANFARHGSATEAYAHSWRRIHRHLRSLHNEGPPIVAGHSMGGSLAIQIGLYSHKLIENTYAFNPPIPGERDFSFYHTLPEKAQEKIQVSANLDDFAFWRIGARIVGKVRLFLGKKRWRYHPLGLFDLIFVIPAIVKFVINVRHAFPAHQGIMGLYSQHVHFQLSEEEIALEIKERPTRFDYLYFFPKLYDPMERLVRFGRKLFGWDFEREYLLNEIEIISLHERDLIDTLFDAPEEETTRQLDELRRQKQLLFKKLQAL